MSITYNLLRRAMLLLPLAAVPHLLANTVSPLNPTVKEGAQQQFAAGTPSTWTTTCGSIATGGLLKAPLYPSTCTITAKATNGSGSASTTVHVVSPIVMTPVSARTPQGGTQQFNSSVPVRWSAKCGSISASGLYTASGTVGSSCTISGVAASGTAYTVYGYDVITAAVSFTVTPAASTTLSEGSTLQFKASMAATWTATCGAINASTGLYTAPLLPGSCTVTATSSTGQAVSTSVTVTSPITITPASASVPQEQTQQFSASVPVGWTASCGSISGTGLFTASAAPNSQCSVEAVASSGTAYTAFGSAAITSPQQITITPASPVVMEGATVQFSVGGTATWSASCGTIDANAGLFTAPGTPGSCTVTATNSLGQVASTTATITAPLTITPATARTLPGQTQQFTASLPATWTATCGSVSSSGLFTAPAAGGTTCSIVATFTTNTSVTATATDTVTQFVGVNIFGDSTACGVGASNYAGDPSSPALVNLNNSWAYVVGNAFNNVGYENYCHSGDQVFDTLETKVLPNVNPDAANQPQNVVVIGINDSYREATGGYCTSSAGCRANYQHALQALVGWLAIPKGNKTFAQDCVPTSGTWAPNPALPNGVVAGASSTSVNAQLTCTVTTPGPLVVAWDASDQAANATHAMAVAVDGTQLDVLSEAGFNGQRIATWHSTVRTQFASHYQVGPGTHTVTFTSLCTDGCTVTPDWLGVPSASQAANPPSVVVGGILHQQNGGSDTFTDAYNSIALGVAQMYQADGLAINFADTRGAVNTTTDMHDQLHPNDTGYANEANAVIGAMQSF